MKPKKALKKLTKTEELLSAVIDRYGTRDHTVHAHLDTAIASVRSAKDSLEGEESSRSAKEPVGKASAPAKKRSARRSAKRSANRT
jgi:hypothetical protein